jgi:hypothetical protein
MESPKVCRRYPPIPIMIGVKKAIAQLNIEPEPVIGAYFPQMAATGWCGEYEAETGEMDA